MAQYLDNAGLQELVKKTKEYARKSAKEAVVKAGPGETSGYGVDRTITGWNDETSAAIYSPIQITENQVTNLVYDLGLKAPLASPAFTGVPTAPTADTSASNTQIATTQYVKNVVGNIGEAMHYKGAVGTEEHPSLPSTGYVAGDTWKVATVGTYAGQQCEVGDMIIANKTYTEGASNADWDVIQTNIDGAVTGPGSATDSAIALFNSSTGKVIKDSGITIETTLSASSDANVPTSKAVNTAITNAINDLDVADITGFGTGNTLATLTETDGKIAATFQPIQIEKSQVTNLETDLANIETSAATLNTKIETSAAILDAKITAVSGAVDNLIDGLDANVDSTGGVNVSANIVEQNGKITSLTLVDNTNAAITSAINALDFGPYSIPTSGTITSISEENGKISVSSGAILISSAQISDLGNVLGNYKTVQTAVSDPSAEGSGITFIDSASQDTNGVITLHKKTVQNASGSQPGLMSADDFTKLSQISTSANRVEVNQSTGVLSIDGASAMGPISTTEIDDLFLGD